MAVHIVLVEPEIPQNTGNIVRTCAVTGSILHLVKPLGFSVEDKYLKRAGLDYWSLSEIHYHECFEEVREEYATMPFFFCTTKASQCYSDVLYPEDFFLVFGKETAGLPEHLLLEHYDHCIRIPMISDARSLNLSNSVAIILYETLRQKSFIGLSKMGHLPFLCNRNTAGV